MTLPAIGHLRQARRFLKATAVLVTVAFLGLYLEPLALAVQLPTRAAPATTAPSNTERLSQTIDGIESRLGKLENKLSRHEDVTEDTDDLKTLGTELEGLDQKALQDFETIGRHLKDKKLPQVILDRQAQVVRTYKKNMAALKAQLDDVDKAQDDTERYARAKKAYDYLKLKNTQRARPKFDPNDLPDKSLQPNHKNTPKLKKSDFVRAGLISNPSVKLAALGDFKFDKLPGASDPAYLAETAEVTLTPAIRAKAQALNYNPVQIYNWVRNNVEWIPTWGAQQDADVTLGSQRGNAMDIASLLIALYRASGIPARYVHGTIEVPADKFMNWAGGFTSITAAADYASAGGIPVTTIVSGGKITQIQLEHVWVEAAIDFHPSRGAVNKSADSWVPLDPSYKQYQDLKGLDVVAISGIDPAALAQSFASSGTVNQTEGWVSGLSPAALQSAFTQTQATLTNYVNTNLPNPTVGDVIGGRKIIANNSTVLPTGLPYYPGVKVRGATYGALPAALQNTMTLAFGTDPLGQPINPVSFPWPKLNNHKVTLSFKPATAADEQTLASLLPSGPITDLSQLPSSIPAYLISVIPELAVDGTVVGQGYAMYLGEDLNFYYDISRVGGIGNQTYTYPVVAGSYESVMVGGGSVSAAALNTLRTKMTETQTTLQSGNDTAIGALTREDMLGDMFQAGTLGYFGELIALSHAASVSQNARHNLPLGYGTFGYEPNVQRIFGFPRTIKTGGVAVNVRLGWVIHSLDGDSSKLRDLNLQTGLLSSALENGVPEQMFSTPTQRADGISAVKALQIAVSQGQRIYHITPTNQVQAMSNLHLDSLAMSEIAQSLASGKEVIAHTDRITVPGWTGEGYILFDPVTGDGAYKIAGGVNGGYIVVAMIFITFAFLAAAAFATGPLGILVAGAFAVFSMRTYTDSVKRISDLVDAGKLTADDAATFVKVLSILTIFTAGLSIAKSVKAIELITQISYVALIKFYTIVTNVLADPYSSPF
ncbi:MAG: transglutaminase-like domain-containing protein [Sulfuricaulis sp.]